MLSKWRLKNRMSTVIMIQSRHDLRIPWQRVTIVTSPDVSTIRCITDSLAQYFQPGEIKDENSAILTLSGTETREKIIVPYSNV